ncbi:MAG: hypothetical protein ACLGIS_13145 [Actinomycetes bacterium]
MAKDVGLIWQGRYILALAAILIAASGVALRNFHAGIREDDGGTVRSAGRRACGLLLGVMVFGHLYSFVYGLRRYVIGIQDQSNWSDMVAAPQWQPPLGWITLSILYLLILAAGAVLTYRFVTGRIHGGGSPRVHTVPAGDESLQLHKLAVAESSRGSSPGDHAR